MRRRFGLLLAAILMAPGGLAPFPWDGIEVEERGSDGVLRRHAVRRP